MISLNNLSLDYDNITLVSSQISSINSRDDVDTSIYLFPDIKLRIPIVASPMVDVVDKLLALNLSSLGGFSFLHRFQSIENQLDEYRYVYNSGGYCGCAIGLNDFDRLSILYNAGCRYFILDIANGANYRVKHFMESISATFPKSQFIVGNVVSGKQFEWCQDLPNVYGVRVGIAGGKACTTKNATGLFDGPVSLIKEAKLYQNKSKILADGGIRSPADFCKALALGSDAIVLGSLIAACQNSPASIVKQSDKWYKVYRGSSSQEIQLLYKDNIKYIEGETVLLEYKEETLVNLIDRLLSGLRSSMSYFNARNLIEYYSNSEYKIVL